MADKKLICDSSTGNEESITLFENVTNDMETKPNEGAASYFKKFVDKECAEVCTFQQILHILSEHARFLLDES